VDHLRAIGDRRALRSIIPVRAIGDRRALRSIIPVRSIGGRRVFQPIIHRSRDRCLFRFAIDHPGVRGFRGLGALNLDDRTIEN
jgi:hypothetical protein